MTEQTSDVESTVPVEQLCRQYRQGGDLLSFLKDVQRRRGFLSNEDISRIASAWGAPVGEVYGVATFYSFLGVGRRGRHLVKICKSTPCCMKHCDAVVAAMQKELGIGNGETTADGQFTLMLTNCIGACDRAPALLVDDDLYQDVAPSSVPGILKRYATAGVGAAPAGGRRA